jgi:copper transport protein
MVMNKRHAAWILLIALILFMTRPVQAVQAHANLIRSNPAPGAALKQFPTTVQMEFTEAVTPSSVKVQLLNSANQLLAEGKPSLFPANPTVLTVSLPAQPDGIYHLNWQVQSAVDGHLTNGSIAFSVGVNTPQVSLLPTPGTPDPAAVLPSWIEVLIRGLGYFSLSLLVGVALFDLLVWQPAYQAEGKSSAEWVGFYRHLISSLVIVGVIAGFFSMLGLFYWEQYQSGALSGPHQHSLLAGVSLLDRTIWVPFAKLLIFFGFLCLAEYFYAKPSSRPSHQWWSGFSIILVGLLLWVEATGSHNAALGGVLPILDDFLHLLGMSAWIGGLLPLIFLLVHFDQFQPTGSFPLIDSLSKRFSRLALTAVIVLGVSGLYSALLQVKTWDALVSTRYGQAILIKTGLFAILIGLGAVNQLKILPAMARVGARAAGWLGRTVRIEYVLAILLLLVIGVLMSLSPAYQALQAQRQLGFHEHYQEGAVQMDLRVAPAQVGENEFGVDIIDHRPGADQVPATVLLRFQMVAEDMGTTQVEAKETSPNRYTARGSYFSMLGAWQVDVILRKSGYDDSRHMFTINLEKLIGN